MSLDDTYFSCAYDKVIITGGGSGMGRASAVALTARGTDVWIMGRREHKLAETAEMCRDNPGRVSFTTCDVRDLASVEAAFAKANADGEARALLNFAGEVWPCAAERLTTEILSAVTSVGYFGAFNVFRSWARPLIRAGKDGVLVTYTSSVASRETLGLSHSSSTKAAVEAMARCWAGELGRFGLRFNVIGPGMFPIEPTLHGRENFFADMDKYLRNIPLGRFGEIDEIVGPTLFLLSKGASYITGASLHVDGGLRIRPAFGFDFDDLTDGEPL